MALFVAACPKIFGIQIGPQMGSFMTTFAGFTSIIGFFIINFGNIPPS